jgi:phosphatidylserine/phosphatidylglycerophosphate/cardiolipin synthase-like enzyme
MEAYFIAAAEAMEEARRSIHFLNWAFEPETVLHPQPGGGGDDGDRIANFLKRLASTRPELDIRILCWKSALPVAATQHFFPLADRGAFDASPVKFRLDGKLPLGACHHQKMLIIDDAVAFCGGGDIGPDRWDTPAHLDNDPRREKTRYDNKAFDSRHEVMSIVDGPPAAALGELFRRRWRRCTGEALPAPTITPPTAWPQCVPPMFTDIAVGLSRTEGAWKGHRQVNECEALHLASISAARRLIYMESQYFTSPLLAAAITERLAEPEGPEVVLISTEHSPSYFDQATMDRTRWRFIAALQAADKFGRFQIYSPVTTLGRTIIVHAKLAIIDDDLLRIGSANINNRSLGFDTECDVSFEADGDARGEIARLRTGLVAHWIGCAGSVVEEAVQLHGGLCGAIEALRKAGYSRLRPITPGRLGPIGGLIANLHLGDPVEPEDAWKPWKRRCAIEAKVRSFNLRRSGARPAANEAEEETGRVVLAGVAPNAV